jgi:hypothetical protein
MKKLLFIPAFLAALLMISSVAGAAQTKPKLSFTKTNAQIGWSNEGGSSPGGGVSNANSQSIRINASAGGGASAFTFGTDEDLVGIRGKSLAQISHLGFDSKGSISAGAPRISLGTTGDDGDHTYFLSAFHCNDATSGGWRTSDFVNDTSNCTIFRDNEPAGMTWAQAVAIAGANNETVIESPSDWFLVVDEAPSLTYVDRLSVQDWCWTGNGNNGIVNENSGDCVGG